MALYEQSEHEQVESLRKWWKENGTAIVVGAAIGLAILAGWRYWQVYVEQKGQQASNIYEQVLFLLETGQIEPARNTARLLLSEYSQSPYAVLAALNLARQDLEEGDIAGSHARLQWIIDQNSSLPELTHIARLRKIRLFLSEGKIAEANHLITGINVGKFKGAYAELQGDIAIAQDQTETARKAYTKALESEDLSVKHRELVQMKLDDLGVEKAARIEAPTPKAALGNPNTQSEEVLTITEPTASALGNPNTQSEEVLTITEPAASEPPPSTESAPTPQVPEQPSTTEETPTAPATPE